MSFYTAWMNSFRGKCKFDVSLFALSEEERKAEFGEDDPVVELRNMTPSERIAMYGTDFAEYFNKSVMNPTHTN
jgi:hypothetical protein